jgi:hypothetical protein
LTINEATIAQVGLEPIPVDIVAEMRTLVNDKDHELALEEFGTISEIRRNIINVMRDFFSDEDRVLSVMGQMNAQDHRFPLFDYLCNTEAENRWELFNELVGARRGSSVTFDGAKHASYLIMGVRPVVELGGIYSGKIGTKIAARTPHEVAVLATKENVGGLSDDSSPLAPEIDTLVLGSVQEDSSPATTEDEDSSAELLGMTEVRLAFDSEFREQINKSIRFIYSEGLYDKDAYMLVNSFSFITQHKVVQAQQSGFIKQKAPRGTQVPKLTARDVLVMIALHHHKEVMGRAKSKALPDRKLAERIIDEELAAWHDSQK